MTQAQVRFSSFDDYLSYSDGTDKLYELYNGKLIEVPPESGENVSIATFLLLQFVPIVGYLRLRSHGLELEVRGEPRNRYPDLTIIRDEHIPQLQPRNTIRLSMLPPLLVIEVVIPGELQRDRDYIAKRRQYEDLGIPEYWIVDPQVQCVIVLNLQDQVYQEVGMFQGNSRIVSPTFPEMNLTTETLLNAGH